MGVFQGADHSPNDDAERLAALFGVVLQKLVVGVREPDMKLSGFGHHQEPAINGRPHRPSAELLMNKRKGGGVCLRGRASRPATRDAVPSPTQFATKYATEQKLAQQESDPV